MTQDINELAKDLTEKHYGCFELVVERIEAFATAIQSKEAEKWQTKINEKSVTIIQLRHDLDCAGLREEKWQSRVSELEEALKAVNKLAVMVADINIEQICRDALANKSDFLAKHDEPLQARVAELEEALKQIADYNGYSTAMHHVIANEALANKSDFLKEYRKTVLLELRQRLTDNDESVQWNIDDMIGDKT
jgi:hypothetical protein